MFREMPKFKPEEILVYLRKSRTDDPNKTIEEVLQMHESLLRAWMDANLEYHVPEENWYREIVSGETIAERPKFLEVLKKIESPSKKAILCVECPRLSRGDMEDCGRLIKLLRYTSTFVIDQQQNRIYDLRDEFDREGFEREIKHSNYYLEYSKKLMKRGLDYTVNNGGYVGSVPPYGYSKIRVQVGKKKIPTLEIIEEEAKVVRMVFDWYISENIGYRTIAERLNDMGIKPMKVKYWNPQSIRKIIQNEHYLGKIRYYAHKIDHVVENLTVTKKKVAVDDYQLFDGMHEAIIDEETFNKARIKQNNKPRCHKAKSLRNPLSSVLYCECGYAMTYVMSHGMPRFACPEQRRCKNASIDATILMDILCDTLKQNIEDFKVEMHSSNDDIIKRQEEKISYIEKKLKDIEYHEMSLWQKYTEEGMPKSVFENLKAKYESEKEHFEKELEKAIEETPQRIDYKERIVALHSAIDGIQSEDVSAEVKNNLVKSCVERISYSRQGSVRVTEKDRENGQNYKRGWIQNEPQIEVTLTI